MKAERRHELRDNDLLHALHVTRDYLNEKGGRVGLAVVIVIVVATALSLGVRSRSAAHEDTWMRKSMLDFSDVEKGRKSLEELATLAQQSNDPSFVLSALLESGQQALRLCQDVAFPPDTELNEVARSSFSQLREQFPHNALAVGASLIGLATVEANEFAHDADPAHKEKIKNYLVQARDSSLLSGLPFQRIAIERLNRLDDMFEPIVTVAPEEAPEDAADSENAGDGDPDIDTP